MPRVVWAEETKNCLGFEIGPLQQKLWRESQLLTDRQSSCKQDRHTMHKREAHMHNSVNVFTTHFTTTTVITAAATTDPCYC